MFEIFWEPMPFDRVQQLLRDHPELKAMLAYTLRCLTDELKRGAAAWGESRMGAYRLGYIGILSVLIRVNAGTGVVRIVNVKRERPR